MNIIKKIILSSISILGISLLLWIIILLNPQLSYANHTQFSEVTVYHNLKLEEGTQQVVSNALSIIKTSDIYDPELQIQLCLNDDRYYPNLYPFAGGIAYAFLNKTVLFASEPNFDKNITTYEWEVNDYELRKYNLTILLAHEFMHNLQAEYDTPYYIKSTMGKINWKFEGHAEYIARGFKQDGRLFEKLTAYVLEEKKEHSGLPIITLSDGTAQILSYHKYALVVQYLMEVKGLNFTQVCALESSLDESYNDLMQWYAKALNK